MGLALSSLDFNGQRAISLSTSSSFFWAFATGTYLPSILPIITETYDYRHWGKAIGFHDSAASLSIFSIPILVAFGLHFLSWRNLLLILGIASLLLPIYFWKVSVEPKKEMSRAEGQIMSISLKGRTVWIMGFLWIFAAGSSLGLYSILPLYLIKERGIDFHFANTLFGISRVGGVFVSILIGFLIDRYGYRRMLMLGIVMTGLSTIGLSLASTLPLILITLILQATLSLAFFPVGLACHLKVNPSFGTVNGDWSDYLHWDDLWNGGGSFSSGLDCRPFQLSSWDSGAGGLDNPFFSDGKVFRDG